MRSGARIYIFSRESYQCILMGIARGSIGCFVGSIISFMSIYATGITGAIQMSTRYPNIVSTPNMLYIKLSICLKMLLL